MISTAFLIFLIIVIWVCFIVLSSSSVAKLPKKDNLSLQEKRFYLDLYNCLPVEYNLSLQTEAECLAHIIRKEKKNKKEYKYFANKFKSSIIDFLILDSEFKPCCVVVMAEKYRKNKDLYAILKSLDIPVFLYNSIEDDNLCYNFNDLLTFLHKY